MQIGPYTGEVAAALDTPCAREQLARIRELLDAEGARVLSRKDDVVCRAELPGPGGSLPVAIKSFARKSAIKDRADRLRGSSAQRSWQAARALAERGVGTPAPLAYLERREGSRLVESYYVSAFDGRLTSFRNELIRLYRHDPDCEKLMVLLHVAAQGVRKLHDAGICHGDMGNQNILLRNVGPGAWEDAQFIDLNRVRVAGASMSDRAFDVSRIHLPSDLFRVFKEMYFDGPVPAAFEKSAAKHARVYQLRAGTRKIRHPIRSRQRERDADPAGRYPEPRDIWIWDDRSAQPVNTMRRPERKKLYEAINHLHVTKASRALPKIYAMHKELRATCFSQPVELAGRIGMAMEPSPRGLERELELLKGLGHIPVLLRLYHHKGDDDLAHKVAAARWLRENGHAVSVALIQDRGAVLNPASWSSFIAGALERIHDCVEWVEVTHAFNRVKWGAWSYREFTQLLQPVVALQKRYPALKWMGPAAIDFEYHYLVTALQHLPEGLRFDALSHLLYVDRRGAPENRQMKFAAVDKFSLARAIARSSDACADRLIVSEVNWPLVNGGIYSPIGAPYLYPGQKLASPPSVSEEDYASYMIRYLVQATCSGMVERVFWWRLAARGFGLVDDTDAGNWRMRPAYFALRHFLQLLGDSTFGGKLASPDGIDLLAFTRTDGEKVVLGYSHGAQRDVHLPFTYRKVEAFDGTGLTKSGASIAVAGSPIYFRHAQLSMKIDSPSR